MFCLLQNFFTFVKETVIKVVVAPSAILVNLVQMLLNSYNHVIYCGSVKIKFARLPQNCKPLVTLTLSLAAPFAPPCLEALGLNGPRKKGKKLVLMTSARSDWT